MSCAGLFSVEILKKFLAINIFSLSMKRSLDNQINAFLIDISRIKWLVFFLWLSVFHTIRLLASSEATAYYRPAPSRTDSIPETSKTMHINPSLQILSWYVKGTGLGTLQKDTTFCTEQNVWYGNYFACVLFGMAALEILEARLGIERTNLEAVLWILITTVF